MSLAGAAMFARFAVPPNLLGYCGPPEHEELQAIASGQLADVATAGRLARGFEGAWPYLELLAGAAGCDDPLAERVVEAYWLGNDVLAGVERAAWGWHLSDRFGSRMGDGIPALLEPVGRGGLACHAFHVFHVYPWVGLLREGRGGHEPLRIMDRCRIRWGRVVGEAGGLVRVSSQPLVWDGRRLGLGPLREEQAVNTGERLEVGHEVALHWDWVCQRIAPRQRWWLQRITDSQLRLANRHETMTRTGY